MMYFITDEFNLNVISTTFAVCCDVKAGYQITQQRQPLAKGGYLKYVDPHCLTSMSEGLREKVARITQIQLEQDSGKSLHDADSHESLIDLNRAGERCTPFIHNIPH